MCRSALHVDRRCYTLALLLAALTTACTQTDGTPPPASIARPVPLVRIEPGPDAPRRLQEALITVQPGGTVELAAGTYDFQGTLSLDVDRVTLRGAGPDETILSFTDQRQGTGGEGLSITSDAVTVEDLAIENPQGDALKTSGAAGITVRNVRAEWTGGPSEENGAYGIYPVQSSNVLVEDCLVIGASDAGIYVGQSENVIVRRNRATGNIAGIEIENCLSADVYENIATGNTGGILVFSLPNLPVAGGSGCRVFSNQVTGNNHPNFAPPGNIVGMVPPGTGIMVMAYDHVEIFDNTIAENQSANLAIFSYLVTEKKYDDVNYDPFCESIYIHDNRFAGGGDKPSGKIGMLLGALTGGTLPDIVYGGIVDEEKMVDGRLPPELSIYVANNGDADFVNLDLVNFEPMKLKFPKISRDLAPHEGSHPPLAPVEFREL